MSGERFVAAPVLAGLKDFQRASVDHVFGELYGSTNADRFLVADEVGLGKTMIAKGVIAKAIEHLWDDIERIDVIYICSNASIAQQNISRLNVMGNEQGFSFASRMTMIAKQTSMLNANKVNFVSFTPGTSFDLKSSTGISGERVLLYWLTRIIVDDLAMTAPGIERLFMCSVSEQNWPRMLKKGKVSVEDIDSALVDGFAEDLVGIDAKARLSELAPAFVDAASALPRSIRQERDALIGQMRACLAKRCVRALEPDLVILDEFQRFRHLMSGDDAAGELAQTLFDVEGNKTLLLSATPYKMFTKGGEDENHHRDFNDMVQFLYNGRPNNLDGAMAAFRSGILDVHNLSVEQLAQLRRGVEGELSKVMVRTERLGACEDRNGMLTEIVSGASLRADDITSYVGLERAARASGGQGVLEYWKSVPSFLNFSDGYKIDKQIEAALVDPATRAMVTKHLSRDGDWLDWEAFRRFGELDGGNGRLRVLQEQTVDNEAWRMLWLAPSLPYYTLGGPWAGERAEFTKRLIFSSWTGTPKAISSLLSYEVERKMFGLRDEPVANTTEDRNSIRGLLAFRRDPQGRPGSMNSFSFVYPCVTLARLGDPLTIAREHGRALSAEEVQAVVRSRIAEALQSVDVEHDSTLNRADPRWYWAAPLLLDRANDEARWMHPDANHFNVNHRLWAGGDTEDNESEDQTESEDQAESEGRSQEILEEHIALARQMHAGTIPLGVQPDDLVDVLVDAALGSPATAGLRSITRVLGERAQGQVCWIAACRIGWGFRSLFNLPDVNSLVRSTDLRADYWRTAVRYCVDGCLSAVLDEYSHLLRESLSLELKDGRYLRPEVARLATAIQEAVGVRTTSLVARDHLGKTEVEPRFRTRYAMRFGNDRAETEKSTVTATHLRQAFNSPFWPFVLTSTSVGQEGLDFHLYCHAIMHWNLPGNPVDLEQREGRVHRFKGHAVRRNVAASEQESAFAGMGDPWVLMFDSAAAGRADGDDELVPFWVFPGEKQIERHVPMLPMSKEVAQLAKLKRDVARYRLVFGQPRQDDLLAYLGDVSDEKLAELRIDLSPRSAGRASRRMPVPDASYFT